MRPFAVMFGIFLALWGALWFYDSPPPGVYDTFDIILLFSLFSSALYTVIIMFFTRDRWYARSLGLWYKSLAVAGTFLIPILGVLGLVLSAGERQLVQDAVRSAVAIGCPLINIELTRYLLHPKGRREFLF